MFVWILFSLERRNQREPLWDALPLSKRRCCLRSTAHLTLLTALGQTWCVSPTGKPVLGGPPCTCCSEACARLMCALDTPIRRDSESRSGLLVKMGTPEQFSWMDVCPRDLYMAWVPVCDPAAPQALIWITGSASRVLLPRPVVLGKLST